MSTTLADYAVLVDNPVHLSSKSSSGRARSKFCRFQLASDFTADVKPVLMFRTTVLDKDTRVNVYVNPEPTENTSSGFPTSEDYFAELGKGYLGLHMEALQGSKFKKGAENTIVFTISGDGTKFGDVIIGDAVLLVQRTV
jgi:hypothetical protein